MLVSSPVFCMPSKLLSLLVLSGLDTINSFFQILILLLILPPFHGYVLQTFTFLCESEALHFPPLPLLAFQANICFLKSKHSQVFHLTTHITPCHSKKVKKYLTTGRTTEEEPFSLHQFNILCFKFIFPWHFDKGSNLL